MKDKEYTFEGVNIKELSREELENAYGCAINQMFSLHDELKLKSYMI